MAIFPTLNTQESLATDTPEVRRDFALLIFIVEIINLSSLFALPMLPRQKKETQELVARGEKSLFWAKFTLWSVLIFLVYSSVVTFMTVAGADRFGCYKILGGTGCTENESSIPVYVLMGLIFLVRTLAPSVFWRMLYLRFELVLILTLLPLRNSTATA